MKNKFSIAMTLAVVLAMLVTSLALADNVVNDVVVNVTDTITAGGFTTVGYKINFSNAATPQDPQAGCNASDGTPLTLALSVPAGVTVTSSDSTWNATNKSLTFSACSVFKYVVLSSNSAGDYPIILNLSDSGTGAYQNNANFSLDVNAPVVTDNTPPVITPNIVGTLGNNDWYTTDVTVTWTVVDNESSISSSSGCGPTTINTDTAGMTLTCTATSAGGTNSQFVTIKRDATAPTSVSGAPNRIADNGTWYNHAVGVVFTGTDVTSGIASCTSTNYSGPDGSGITVNGSCTDNAGNASSSVASSAFNYDATAPTVTVTPDRSADQNGWYNHSVDFTTAGTDDTSDIASCTGLQTYSGPDGSDLTVSGSCTDDAGNVGNGESVAFDYDATAPYDVAVAADRGPDSNGWYNHTFSATWNGIDDASGIASCTATPYSGPDTNTGSLSGNCTDVAGNTSGSVAFAFKYDATKPTIVAAVSAGTLGLNGWYVSEVTVHFTCSDNLSGVVGCPVDQVLSTEGTGISSSVQTVMDAAGNTSEASNVVSVNIDKTAPSITITTPPAGASYLLNQLVAASYSCSDGTSGIATCVGPVASGSNIDTAGTGPKSFMVNASDAAGNTNSATNNYSVAFKLCVLYDQTKSHKSGSTVPLKLQLCDFNGVNYSSAAITVRAISVSKLDNSASGILDDSGAANSPDMNFRYDATLGGSGGYIFNLSTKGLTTGTWKVTFTINGASDSTYFVRSM